MGKILLVNFNTEITFKIWRITIFKSVYHSETLGGTSGFPEITVTSSAHCI